VARRKDRPAPARPGRVAGSLFERSALREAIVAVAALKVAALIVVFDPGGLQSFDLPKSLASRALAWALAGLIAVAVLRHGIAIVPRSRLHLAVAAYVAVVIASAALADNRYMALYGDWGRFLGVTFVLDMLVLYVAVAIAFRMETDRRVLFGAVAGASALSIAYAALQAIGADPVRWSIDPRMRPFGTLGNPDHFAHLLAVVAGASLAVAMLSGATRQRAIAVTLAAAAIVMAGLVATRAVVAGSGAAGVALLLVWLATRRASGGGLGRAAAALAVAIVLGGAVVAITPLGARLAATLQGSAVADRVLIWELAARMAADRPLLGWGPDSFGAVSLRYRQPGSEATLYSQRQNSAHDWALQAAATTGLGGLAALLVVIVAFGASLWRALRPRPEVAGPALVAFATYWAQGLFTVGANSVDWVPWVCGGLAVAMTAAPLPAERARPRQVRAAEIAIAAATLVAMLSGASAYRANVDAKTATTRASARDGAGAVAAAISATRSDSGRSEYWVALGRAQSAAGSERDAADAYAEATKRDPWSSDHWQHLGASLTRLALAGDQTRGGAAAALAAARKAVEVDPYTSVPHFHLATVTYNLDDPRTALRESVRAIELFQGDPEYDRVAALAAGKLGDAEARDLIKAALKAKDSDALRAALADLDKRLGG